METAQYIELLDERVYTITYGCKTPEAWVLLCGPFPSDRLFSLASWVKWARFLARNNIAAVRFDYRGTGESSGHFSDMDFEKWRQDVEGMYERVSALSGRLPVVVHGLGMGGLLAQKVFATARGDALLLWAAPQHALDILKQALMIRMSMDMLLYRPAERKSAKQYIHELQTGRPIQVDGYTWSSALWSTAEHLSLSEAYAVPGQGVEEQTGRAWQHTPLDSSMAPLVRTGRILRAMNPRAADVPSSPLNPDFNAFFEGQVAWIRSTVQKLASKSHA